MSSFNAKPETEMETVYSGAQCTKQTADQDADPSIPPADGGKAAWKFLAAAWLVETLVFGFTNSFGVFLDHYRAHASFAGSENIAVIGTTASGIMNLATPFFLAICRTYPRAARYSAVAGIILSSVAFAASSACRSVPPMIVTQGVLTGLGGCMACTSCVLYTEQWFVKRRCLAYGILWSATGCGGVVFPLVMSPLLCRFDFPNTLRIWSGILFVIGAPLAYFFVRPRLPCYSHSSPEQSPASTPTSLYPTNTILSSVPTARPPTAQARSLGLRYFSWPVFSLHQLANLFQALGYFLPPVYLPTYARAVLLDSSSGNDKKSDDCDFFSSLPATMTVVVLNLTAALGCVAIGWLTDRWPATECALASSLLATSVVSFLWGLSPSGEKNEAGAMATLYMFCVLYGLFAGSFSALWPGIAKEVESWREHGSRNHSTEYIMEVDQPMIISWFCAGRGLGYVVSGPISDALVRDPQLKEQMKGGFGSDYGPLIVFIAVSAMLGGSSFIWKLIGVW